MKLLTEATLYRDAGNVSRYHAKRTIRQQSVAEHTFGVLMLVKMVWPADAEVYEAILHHDLPELITGDVPAPIKRAHPELGPLMDSIEQGLTPLYRETHLSSDEEAVIKWADRMELVLWCLEEYKMGNTYMVDTIRRGLGWILTSRIPCAQAQVLTDEVVEEVWKYGLAPATGAELEMKR